MSFEFHHCLQVHNTPEEEFLKHQYHIVERAAVEFKRQGHWAEVEDGKLQNAMLSPPLRVVQHAIGGETGEAPNRVGSHVCAKGSGLSAC